MAAWGRREEEERKIENGYLTIIPPPLYSLVDMVNEIIEVMERWMGEFTMNLVPHPTNNQEFMGPPKVELTQDS